MSQLFDASGKLTPVTLVAAGPCIVLQKKTKEKEGYEALQVGFIKIEKKSKIKKTMKGKEYRYVRENRAVESKENIGGVKRHGFHGRNASHGVKHEQRTIGSVGTRFPQHVMKGRRMPGRMGTERTTVKNLRVMKIDKDNNLLVVKGAVPGRNGALLEIRA